MKDSNFIVVALGGSIVVSKKIQVDYLKRFRRFIEERINRGDKFIIVVGGGTIARNYQSAASDIVDLTNEDKDWIGIHSTRLNAHFLRTIFYSHAYPVVLDSPYKKINKSNLKKYSLFIASGWRPGWSTDTVAFLLAKRFVSKKVLVATKVSYVYESDVSVNKKAKPFKKLSWSQYKKLLPSDKWIPGMKAPVDPVAAKFASENKIACLLFRGTNIENLEKVLEGKDFQGTIIGK